MHDKTLGSCGKDNQGSPLPNIGGTCNLASMHLDSSTIETPEPLMNDLQATGLDWEFYDLDPQASAGAQPASQNDFYGNMYSLSSFFSGKAHEQVPNPSPTVVIQKQKATPCGCNGKQHSQHAPKTAMPNYMNLGLLVLVALYIFKKLD